MSDAVLKYCMRMLKVKIMHNAMKQTNIEIKTSNAGASTHDSSEQNLWVEGLFKNRINST